MNAQNYNYDAIIEDMVEYLKERVEEGCDVYDAAFEIVEGSPFVIWTKHHYRILDMCRVDPADVVSEFGIDYGQDFNHAIAQTVACCLHRDVIDEYENTINEEDEEDDE